jgi:hypothetical protein
LKRVSVLLFKIKGGWLGHWLFQRLSWGFQFSLMRLPVKSPELVSVFIGASMNLKSFLLNN